MNKYRNIKTVVDGIKFDSRKEANRYTELKLLEQSGLIKDLQLQKKYILIPKSKTERECAYIADFYYVDTNAECVVVEDVKGVKTRDYVIKRKLFKWLHQEIDFKEVM